MMDGKSIRNKLIGSDDERAVSPVIGVILMVAITVILAAVIAAFVLDMGSNQEAPAQAGLNIENNTTAASNVYDVTITSMGDNVDNIRCTNSSAGSVSNGSSVGDTFQCTKGDNVVATTDSGSETVIQSNVGN